MSIISTKNYKDNARQDGEMYGNGWRKETEKRRHTVFQLTYCIILLSF